MDGALLATGTALASVCVNVLLMLVGLSWLWVYRVLFASEIIFSPRFPNWSILTHFSIYWEIALFLEDKSNCLL